MAQQTSVHLVDDLDGSSNASETVVFGLEGATYEIDLTEEHAKELRGSLDLFVQHARRTSRRKVGHQDNYKRTTLTPDSRLVRAWAKENDVKVSAAGRISQATLDAYEAAH